MFYLKEWSKDLDLDGFYRRCASKGFINNSSEKKLIKPFKNKNEWNCWILYSDNTPIGSTIAHSFDDIMGPGTYRILARTCTFQEYSPVDSVITINMMAGKHQNFSDQFFFPECLEWAGDSRVFATSNGGEITPVESQRLVHNYYFPKLESLGLVTKIDTMVYKNTLQTIWEIHKKEFLEHLDQYPRWQ